VLLERPTNDSVELAIGFLKECGQLLTKVSPKGVNGKEFSHMLIQVENIEYRCDQASDHSIVCFIIFSLLTCISSLTP
jgi:hypothetical protein